MQNGETRKKHLLIDLWDWHQNFTFYIALKKIWLLYTKLYRFTPSPFSLACLTVKYWAQNTRQHMCAPLRCLCYSPWQLFCHSDQRAAGGLIVTPITMRGCHCQAAISLPSYHPKAQRDDITPRHRPPLSTDCYLSQLLNKALCKAR